MEQLKSVCFSVCNSLKISESTASDWIMKIMAQFSEENRYYHNVQMLEKKMELIEELSVSNEALRNSLALASVFQYFHFDGKRDHKEENCDEFRLFVDQAGIKDSELVEKVLNMLEGSVDDEETELFREIDLAILGAPTDEYEKYSQGVALEYASDDYEKDRLKMLKTLLTIPHIFSLQSMRDKFEETARQNIQAEIEKLSKQ